MRWGSRAIRRTNRASQGQHVDAPPRRSHLISSIRVGTKGTNPVATIRVGTNPVARPRVIRRHRPDSTSDPEASPRFVSKGGTPTPCESKGAGTDSGEDSSSSSAAPDVIAKCAKEVMRPGLVKETWAEHVRVHGPHHKGPRCRFMRCRDKYEAALTYDLGNGESGTWLVQVCTVEHAWGLGCKLCRWAGKDTAFARGEIRGERATQLARLRRHAHADRCHAHREALEEL